MQIRLTVTLGARGSGQGVRSTAGAGAACDVVVTAPSGTPLSAVTGALASAAASASGGAGAGSTESAPDAATVYVGTERLDPHHQALGEPPLLDGAVVSLQGPALPATTTGLAAYGSAKARLHIVAGPDAGGIHLLQGGKVQLGRGAETDVPLDDPDVSRLHCAVTVTDGGAVTVTDLGSTNGTSLDGAPVGRRPVLFRPGSTLRIGESAVRLETSPPAGASAGAPAGHAGEAVAPAHAAPSSVLPSSLPTMPDGNGQLRLVAPQDRFAGEAPAHSRDPAELLNLPSGADAAAGALPRPYGGGGPFPDDDSTHGAGFAAHVGHPEQFPRPGLPPELPPESPRTGQRPGREGREPGADQPRARGLGAWARRLAGARSDEQVPGPLHEPFPGQDGPVAHAHPGTDPGADAGPGGAFAQPVGASGAGAPPAVGAPAGEERPDPAAVLLTALGPGPRLWEREPDHPDALTVRIGTPHRTGGRPGEPVVVGLRDAGSLGLAGPRPRLLGLARSVVAQLAALHGPSTLEIVLLATDRSRGAEVRAAEWAWLGWLPHLRPVHGQDCGLLTAYDRDQATARTTELSHRLEEALRTARTPDSMDSPGAAAGATAGPAARGTAAGHGGHCGPYTLLVVDGDPGSAALREAVARLAVEGPSAGIHVLCLAETPAATPASPLSETVEAACTSSSAFRECGAVAMLSGAVATAVRVVRRSTGATAGTGAGSAGSAVATVDAVSAAWAERFARALAPLREPEGTAARTGTDALPSVTLPRTSRLLDELGLARATPAALLSRWAGTADSAAGRAALVFGAGQRGPLEAELTAARGHTLITGSPGSGKTELLRSLAASLSSGERPDRLHLVLLDGDGEATGEGLRSCLELPHARHHLAAGDPVRMREFAQSLSGEVKRRAELFGAEGTYEEFARAAAGALRMVSPRQSPDSDSERPVADRTAAQARGSAEDRRGGGQPADATGTGGEEAQGMLRLRTQESQRLSGSGATTGGPTGSGARLPRLIVLVDDFDTLVDPALGNPGRPAAGSVVRALEAVAREGARLGVHLVAASGRADRTAGTAVAQAAALRAELTEPGGDGGTDARPGRGTLTVPADGSASAFQSGRITGRIPRTSTRRPTVVPLDWTRAGDPPTRRPVRELGNGPTDLALLASAIDKAAQSLGLDPRAPLDPPEAATP